MFLKGFIFIFFQFYFLFVTLSQGCSDAGFCTIEGVKPEEKDSTSMEFNNQVKIGGSIGKADRSIFAYSFYAEYNRSWNKKFGTDFKLTSLLQQGNGISSYGLSDFYVTANYELLKNFKIIGGVKIPLNAANKKGNEGFSLPMDYQSSLGTFDAILGIGYAWKKIQFTFAMQQPLIQNKNQFQVSDYPATSPLSSFQSTIGFRRSGDVLARISYPLKLSKKWKFTPSILPIYHLKEDYFEVIINGNSELISIPDSDGLTLNLNGFIDFAVTEKSSLQLSVGAPLVVRKARPDGLTRSWIVNLEYRFKF